jgi:uncharacterized protein involved in exopolysaccharide biosynthesis
METPKGSSHSSAPAAGRLVYVVTPDELPDKPSDELDLFRLAGLLWKSWRLIVVVTVLCTLGALLYASLVTPLYTASVVLSPVKEEPLTGLTSQLGGLASLAGLAGLGGGGDSADAVAVLRSRDFVRAFIEDQSLVPVLFADAWDEKSGQWKTEQPPDAVQAARYFVARVRRVEQQASTDLVTLSIDWRDPELAAAWANQLAVRLNEHMRRRALTEAEANVKYLRSEFESTSVVALQQSISGLLESEMQKLMLARGNSEYAFRIIDRAEVPRAKSKPRVVLIVGLATAFGGMLAVFIVLLRDMLRNRAAAASRVPNAPSERRV